MTGFLHSGARALTVLACAGLVAPAALAAPAARDVPIALSPDADAASAARWSPADEIAGEHRRWRGHRRHGGGIDGGDLLGGLLILGGIAAVAGAIDKSQEENRQRTRGQDYPYPEDGYSDGRQADRPYDDREGDRRGDWNPGDSGSARELDRAVEACRAEAGRAGRVDEIFDVDRIDGEWRVRGDYANGRDFTCTVDSSGRAFVGTGDRSDNSDWDARGGGDVPVARVSGPDDEDGRYDTARAPDFEDPRSR